MKPITLPTLKVQAIQRGATMLRLPVKPQPGIYTSEGESMFRFQNRKYFAQGRVEDISDCFLGIIDECPYKPGEILYVREACRNVGLRDFPVFQYKSTYPNKEGQAEDNGFNSPVTMPREAARLFLKVKEVRVERLGDITEEDAIREGVEQAEFTSKVFKSFTGYKNYYRQNAEDDTVLRNPKDSFRTFWQAMYKTWGENKWVWVISFEQIEKPNYE